MRYSEEQFEELIRTKVNEQLRARNKAYNPARAGSGDDGGFDSFGEFLKCVRNAELKSKFGTGEIDDRLETKAGSPSAREQDPAWGGFLIPESFRNELLSVALEESGFLKDAMVLPLASNNISIPAIAGFDRSAGMLYGGISFRFISEEEQLTAVRPKLQQIGLKLKKLGGLCFISSELLEDSPVTVSPLYERLFRESLRYTLEEYALYGSGAAEPLGILNSPCLITVDIEQGQSGKGPIYENVLNMFSRCYGKSKAVWYASDDLLPTLGVMNLAVGTGGIPVFMPAGGASGQPFSTLFGRPIVFSDHMATVGTVGDLILADMSQFIVAQKSGGVRFDVSIHLKFDYDQSCFRFIIRTDMMPWWSGPLTPRHSSQTLSPFVALATRS